MQSIRSRRTWFGLAATTALAQASPRGWLPAVTKKTFSNHTRILFVAGIEGTGHHLVAAEMKKCSSDKGLCVADPDLSKQLYSNGASPSGMFVEMNAGLAAAKAELVTKLKALITRRKASGAPPATIVLNTLGESGGRGMMSYPNFGGQLKAMHHPDIVALGDAAELAGADLRVLVLHRNATEVVQSTVARRFGSYTQEPAVLVDNAMVLAGQLALLDPAFYACANVVKAGKIPFSAWNFFLPITLTMDQFQRYQASSAHSTAARADITADFNPVQMNDYRLEVANLDRALRLIQNQCRA